MFAAMPLLFAASMFAAMPHLFQKQCRAHVRLTCTYLAAIRFNTNVSINLLVEWCFAMANEQDKQCSICKDIMQPHDIMSLQCGHVYHEECIKHYATVKKVNIADIKCPTCKETSHDLRARENDTIIEQVDDANKIEATVAEPTTQLAAETLPRDDAGDVTDEPKEAAGEVKDDNVAVFGLILYIVGSVSGLEPRYASDDVKDASNDCNIEVTMQPPASNESKDIEVTLPPPASNASNDEPEEAAGDVKDVNVAVFGLILYIVGSVSGLGPRYASDDVKDAPKDCNIEVTMQPPGSNESGQSNASGQLAVPHLVRAVPHLVRAASEGFQIDAVPAWQKHDLSLTCCDCGQECTRFRVCSKGKGTARCAKCAYVLTRLYRANGPGGLDQLAQLTANEKHAFFLESHEPLSAKAQKALFEKTLENYRTRERVFEMGGVFKPLGAWGMLGYDTKIIAEQSLPTDIMPHRMFGFVYRVPLLYVGDKGADGYRSSDAAHAVHSAPRPKRLRALPAVAGDDGEQDNEQGEQDSEQNEEDGEQGEQDGEQGSVVEDDRSSESSCSTSSSSSSSVKNKKKKKNKFDSKKAARKAAKKEKKRIAKEKKRQNKQQREERDKKKQAEKEARAAERAKEKLAAQAANAEKSANKKGMALAKACCKRMEVLIASIQKTMRLPGAAKIPDYQKNPLREILAQLEALLLEVQPVSTGRKNAAGFSAPPEEKALSEASKKHQALFTVAAKTYDN